MAGYGYLANSPLVGNITFQRNGTTVMTTTKQYDLLNRLTSIGTVGGTNNFTYNYSYNPANQRTSVTNADNSYWVYQYDNLGQVISGKKYWSSGTPVAGQQFTYNFDDIGNRKSTASGGDATGSNLRSATYFINNLNQYTSRSVPGYATILGSANSNATVSVNLQRAVRQGNYFADEVPVTNTSAAIYQSLTNLAVLNNGTNADITVTNLGSVLIPQTPEAFVYDLDGNMTTNGRWTALWDGENRATNFTSLSTLPTAAKIKVDCVYDFQGRRVQKVVSTNNGTTYITVSTNRYIYDGWNLIGILDGGNNLQYSFQWGTDLSGTIQGAGGVGGLISMTIYSGANAGTYDYAYDGNGDVTGLINVTNSQVAAQYEYDAFGNPLRSTGTLALSNPVQFSTKFYDLETKLNHYGYRYYDANQGRWLSRDPIEELGGINLYGAMHNDPLDKVDMRGHDNFGGREIEGTYNNNVPTITIIGNPVYIQVYHPAIPQMSQQGGIQFPAPLAYTQLVPTGQYAWSTQFQPDPLDVLEALALENAIIMASTEGFGNLARLGVKTLCSSAVDSGVWRLSETTRGTVIEDQLAATEYKDWFRVGQLDNGTFPLVDFQNGNNLVSLKTADTTGSSWLQTMEEHIQDLGTRGATVDNNPANMILDLRVQPGGSAAAQSLIDYGQQRGVTVIINEFH